MLEAARRLGDLPGMPALVQGSAEEFFARLVPSECPDYYNEDDFNQLKLIRDQWI